MHKVLSFGEIMLEMSDVGDGLYRRSFAGDTFNMAYYMRAVAGEEIDAFYMTAVGTDQDSDDCIKFIENYGVNSTACYRDPDHTIGLFILSNDENGEKQYGYWRGQAAARHLFVKTRKLSGYDIVYFSGISAAVTHERDNLIASIASASAAGSKIVYDLNYRPKLWTTEQARDFNEKVFSIAKLIKISDEELETLYPSLSMDEISTRAPQAEWVLTCNGGRVEIWKNGTLTEQETFEPVAKVIDSSAAGDSFIATFIASKLQGKTNKLALACAHMIASQVVCFKGSIGKIDTTILENVSA